MAGIYSFEGVYNFLSNFYPSKVTYEGQVYRTVEHAFQAAKTINPKQRQEIQRCLFSGDAKKKGRKVKLRPDWEIIKFQVMRKLLDEKFNDSNLQDQIANTDGKYLEEGNNWHDNTYGNCFCERCENNKGQNMLGKMLMEIRDIIQGHTMESKISDALNLNSRETDFFLRGGGLTNMEHVQEKANKSIRELGLNPNDERLFDRFIEKEIITQHDFDTFVW